MSCRWAGLRAALGCFLLATLLSHTPAAASGDPTVRIDEATLVALSGERAVRLPHILEPSDFEAQGSLVQYVLRVSLEAVPREPLAIYVPKMSKGGNVRLNGVWVGTCALGDIEMIRCLHQPQFFVPPVDLWRQGDNEVAFELSANDRQANGLSRVTIGPAVELSEAVFSRHYFLQVELLRALAWSMACFGLVSLALSALFKERDDTGFFWFGVTSLVNALCNLNVLVQSPTVSIEFFAWFVFSARLVSIPLLILTVLTFFRQAAHLRRRLLVSSILLMPVAVWATGNDPDAVGVMYMPFLLLCPVLLVAAIVWTRRSGRIRDAIVSAVLAVLVAAGVHDWFKFTGVAAFERTYLLSYANALMLLVMGGVIVATIADALRRTRVFADQLQQKVAEKETELRGHYARQLAYEQQAARAAERDQLLRDMHDGMGSSLSTARILLRSGRITVQDAERVLQECIDDLRLMIEASANPEGDLEAALADFRFRIEQRLEPEGVSLRWRIELDGMPTIRADDMLQLMRIVQEAVSNALRHARARTIEVAALWDPGAGSLSISVRDDGQGIRVSEPGGRGIGIDNMRRRAASLRAKLLIEDASPGTRVTVEVLLPPHAA